MYLVCDVWALKKKRVNAALSRSLRDVDGNKPLALVAVPFLFHHGFFASAAATAHTENGRIRYDRKSRQSALPIRGGHTTRSLLCRFTDTSPRVRRPHARRRTHLNSPRPHGVVCPSSLTPPRGLPTVRDTTHTSISNLRRTHTSPAETYTHKIAHTRAHTHSRTHTTTSLTPHDIGFPNHPFSPPMPDAPHL